MAVDPAFARQGVDHALLNHLEEVKLNLVEIQLNARQAAVPFYLRHGYLDLDLLLHFRNSSPSHAERCISDR